MEDINIAGELLDMAMNEAYLLLTLVTGLSIRFKRNGSTITYYYEI